ncbi:hypothetical protein MRX96_049445 [Rhipicephalus microplus]
MIGYVGITLDFKPQAKLIDRKASATEHGLPATLLPGFARDDVERPGEAGGNGPEPTAIADDVEESSSAADAMVNEYEDLTRHSGTPQTSTSFSGDESNAGRWTKPNCQAVVYTYCPVARREFHYRPSVHERLSGHRAGPDGASCVLGASTGSPPVPPANTAASLVTRPKDACFDMPLFSGCERYTLGAPTSTSTRRVVDGFPPTSHWLLPVRKGERS